MSVPQHIAIILDGNGRWAKAQGRPRTFGHTAGAKNVEVITEAAHNMGVKYLTLYAFSTENWSRSADEVAALMKLLDNYLRTCLNTARKNNMRVRVIGDISRFEPRTQAVIRRLEEESAVYDGINLTIAINYGSRDEIRRAVTKLARQAADGTLLPEAVTEETISAALDTAELPDPDLLIRTSGEQRLSNYLLWQMAYTEFYFTPVPWPAFDAEQLALAIEAYENRDRRYGGVEEATAKDEG